MDTPHHAQLPVSTDAAGRVVGAHASVVGYQNRGLLILGHSGVGKSRLAAEVMALGGNLVADDQVQFAVTRGMLVASSVPHLAGIMELRHMGLIRVVDYIPTILIHLAVELVEGAEPERLPEPQIRDFMGVEVPFLQLPPPPRTSAAAIILYLKAMREGRNLPTDWHPMDSRISE